MFLNNFRFAFRHLTRQKLNTTLHVFGLTLGMSVCLLIGLFLRYELSFDNYHKLAKRTYRINSVWMDSGNTSMLTVSFQAIKAALANPSESLRSE